MLKTLQLSICLEDKNMHLSMIETCTCLLLCTLYILANLGENFSFDVHCQLCTEQWNNSFIRLSRLKHMSEIITFQVRTKEIF